MKNSNQRARLKDSQSPSNHKTERPLHAVSHLEVKTFPASTVVAGENGTHILTLILRYEDFSVFNDERGRFVVDCPQGHSIKQSAECGEYEVQRQRLILDKYEALMWTLNHIMPEVFLDLLGPTMISLSGQSARLMELQKKYPDRSKSPNA